MTRGEVDDKGRSNRTWRGHTSAASVITALSSLAIAKRRKGTTSAGRNVVCCRVGRQHVRRRGDGPDLRSIDAFRGRCSWVRQCTLCCNNNTLRANSSHELRICSEPCCSCFAWREDPRLSASAPLHEAEGRSPSARLPTSWAPTLPACSSRCVDASKHPFHSHQPSDPLTLAHISHDAPLTQQPASQPTEHQPTQPPLTIRQLTTPPQQPHQGVWPVGCRWHGKVRH